MTTCCGAPLAGLFLLFALPIAAQEGGVDVHRLPLGNPLLRYDLRLLTKGQIYGQREDRVLSFEELIGALSRRRVVLLGETHDNLEQHRFQARVVEALAALGPLVVGMEFFTPADDAVLAEYTSERIGLEAMLVRANWPEQGGFNYRYYRPILEAARGAGAALAGINVPREVVRAVSRGGLEALSSEQRGLFPPVDTDEPGHRYLIRTIFGRSAVADQEFFERFYAAQCIWDTAMAANLLAALDRAGEGARAAVIVGSGHVLYDLCIGRRIRDLRPEVGVASVVLLGVEEQAAANPFERIAAMPASRPAGPHGSASAPGRIVSRSLGAYLVGTGASTPGGDFPPAPLRAALKEGALVIAPPARGGAAAKAGLRAGDRLLALDGRCVATPGEAALHMMGKDWGDALVVRVGREGAELEARLVLSRPASGPAKRPESRPATRPAREEPPAGIPHHRVLVKLEPESGGLSWTDRLLLPSGLLGRTQGRLSFLLHEGLELRLGGDSGGAALRAGAAEEGGRRWHLDLAPPFAGPREVELIGSGRIQEPPRAVGPDQARGFSVTRGTIGPEGVFLTGASRWVPALEGVRLITFELEARGPAGWELVSQGRRTAYKQESGGRMAAYQEHAPQEEITLVGGPLSAYDGNGGDIATQVLLRKPDPALAGRYLAATAAYIDLYSRLIGPYPWAKFATVENFWETGYGMPSFTLLGPSVLRFPWILDSSFPHEILHNWWGNGVYVDYAKGNWCEGLTAYLADHLLKERKGEGRDHRRYALERYTSFAAGEGRDFPLVEFRERHSPASEAVGYGKSMLLFHMLRRMIGDERFLESLRAFYGGRLHKVAAWDDVRAFFEAGARRDLGSFFEQWVERTGAPLLRGSNAACAPAGEGFELSFRVLQEQAGPAYRIALPYAVYMDGLPRAALFTAELEEKQATVRRRLPARPLRVDLDPGFDLFRRLLPGELPPALSRVLGARRALVVLPAEASAEERADLDAVARVLAAGREGEVRMVRDDDPALGAGLPEDTALWILGRSNGLRSLAETMLLRCETGGERAFDLEQGSLVLALPHPERADLALAYVAVEPGAGPALARKVAHYGRYGWLSFSGPAAVNTGKGAWAWTESPLFLPVRGPGGEAGRAPASALPPDPVLWPAPEGVPGGR